ncbi:MAG: hypothetical protein CMN78_05300 [Spirochaetales bacterium]|nr:hypothetical protein [Spirochaetales bacterium]
MLNIGFIYDFPPSSSTAGTDDVSAEYEDQQTIDWIRGALKRLGETTDIPWGRKALQRIIDVNPHVLFNITEASGSRNRESLVPAIAECVGIACTGSDSVSLGISLDKYLTKVIAADAGVRTPTFALILPGDGRQVIKEKTRALQYPIIIKPNTGGSSMGIRARSRVENYDDLLSEVTSNIDAFHTPMLIEEFVPGREITAGIISAEGIVALPVAEISFGESDPNAFYSIERKSVHKKTVVCPAESIPASLSEEINMAAESVFLALGCAGFARVDFRISVDGTPFFIEINPLPGLSPFYSIFPMQVKAWGAGGEDMIRMIINDALARNGDARRC